MSALAGTTSKVVKTSFYVRIGERRSEKSVRCSLSVGSIYLIFRRVLIQWSQLIPTIITPPLHIF